MSERTAEPAGQAVLDDLGARLVAVVRGVTGSLDAIEKRYEPRPRQMSGKDLEFDDPWPQLQVYTGEAFTLDDSRPLARQVAIDLRIDGWDVADLGALTGAGSQHYLATKDGFALRIGSARGRVPALTIIGSTPTVTAAGEVDPA